jgi:hypothetical protein
VFALGLAVGDGAGQLQHLHHVREREASRDLSGFEHSFGGASVTVFGAAVQDGDVFPGKGFQLRVQAGLVGLDGEDVVAAGLDDGLGGLPLAVQRVGGDDRVGDVDRVEKCSQHGDLVGLGSDGELGEHGAGGLAQSAQQVHQVPGRVARAAQRLAVEGDHPPPGDHGGAQPHPRSNQLV